MTNQLLYKTAKNIVNSAPYAISRLSSEVAYLQNRLCIRNSSQFVKNYLAEAMYNIELALQQSLEESGEK